MKLKTALILIILLFPAYVWAADKGGGACDTCADTNWSSCTAADAERSTLSTCVTNANTGATITVPADTATWTASLAITKGISLIANGIGNTVITAGGAGCADGLITYRPADFTLNSAFRVSGFSFNSTALCTGIGLLHSLASSLIPQTKIRIDHNAFDGGTNAPTSIGGIWNEGMRGVVDNNTFSGYRVAVRNNGMASNGSAEWNDMTGTWGGVVFGAPYDTLGSNMYFEDNTFDYVLINGDGDGVMADCQNGDRYAFRYNTITNNLGLLNPGWDQHGDYSGTPNSWSCFGSEIYGNKIVSTTGGTMSDLRGGRHLVFGNKSNATDNGYKVREEYTTNATPETATYPEILNGSYFWNNRKSSTTYDAAYISTNVAWVNGLAANTNFWEQNTSYNGTTEIGVGCAAALPTPWACTVGDGFWVPTNIANTPCSSVRDAGVGVNENVGKDATLPQLGVLYTCTALNTWTAYYTPYEYPHPLRGEGGATYFDLTVTKPTFGTITSADTYINCGTGGNLCSYTYASTDSAVLTFTPDTGYYLSAKNCAGITTLLSPQTVAMTEARTCTATFTNGRAATIGTGGTMTIGTGGTATVSP